MQNKDKYHAVLIKISYEYLNLNFVFFHCIIDKGSQPQKYYMQGRVYMRRSVGKIYIKKEKKWNVICTLVVLCIMAVVIAILELIPGGSPELGYSDMNGMGRSFLYPFVFTDSRNDLYILKDDMSVTAIDDGVTSPLHDPGNDQIYYVKNRTLYEYSIKSNDRVALNENTAEFSLLGNRRAVVCRGETGDLALYMFRGNQTKPLAKSGQNENTQNPMYAVSDEGVLFSNGNSLIYSDYLGRTTTITEELNTSRKFYISDDGELICYYVNEIMHICELDGSVIYSGDNVQPVLYQQTPVFVIPSTLELESGDGIPFKYFLKDINTVSGRTSSLQSGNYTVGTLQYFTGSALETVSKNVYRVIYYSKNDNFLLFSVLDGNEMDIYMTTDGNKPIKQIRCGAADSFIFDDRTNYLYYQDQSGELYRYDVYDVDCKTVKVASGTGNIYDYYNRPFIAYEDAAQNEIYLVYKDKIERMDSNTEMRLYGRSNDIYLLCRQNADGNMTMDYVKENRLTRIANNVGTSVFFDRDLESVIYSENDVLYVWNSNQILQIGQYRNIRAADIVK